MYLHNFCINQNYNLMNEKNQIFSSFFDSKAKLSHSSYIHIP